MVLLVLPELPLDIIKEIQSRLSRRDGTMSCFFSRSWNQAWLSRNDIVFDQRDFQVRGERDLKMFHDYVAKVLKSHDDNDARIFSCMLFVDNTSTAKDVMLKVVKLGATRIEIEFTGKLLSEDFLESGDFLESEDFLELSARCQIDGKENCSSLKSLRFCNVCIDSDSILDILSRCLLIEKLVISHCKFKSELLGPDLATPRHHLVLRFLDFLVLDNTFIPAAFYEGLRTVFPCLKGLDIRHCSHTMDEMLNISSDSLENLQFTCLWQYGSLRARFDVPKIQKFSYSGRNNPILLFEEMKGHEWESHIHMDMVGYRPEPAFRKLKKCLMGLKSSKISLSLTLGYTMRSFDFDDDNLIAPKCVVDTLKMKADSRICWYTLRVLFRHFCPRSICVSIDGKHAYECQQFLVKKLDFWMDGHVLESVAVEAFDDDAGEFRPWSWEATKASMVGSSCLEREVRFKIQWANC